VTKKNKPDKPLNILIIEDENEYVAKLQSKARDFRIILKHFQTLEESKEFLKSNDGKSIDGVILDVHCKKYKNQKPDSKFITEALDYFNLKHPKLPKAVLTGVKEDYQGLQKYYDLNRYKIFEKGDGEEEILRYLQKKAEALPSDFRTISEALPEVIEVFEKGYLDILARDEFIYCFKHKNSSTPKIIENNLIGLRKIQEKIYEEINKVAPIIVPVEYISKEPVVRGDNKQSKGVRGLIKYLYDKKLIDEQGIIRNFSFSVYSIASDEAHPNTKSYPPTKYTVQALFFALCDLLLWFKGILDNHTQ
jgi:hypothetical protein